MSQASNRSVLVVDDNPMNRDILARRLAQDGYHVETAGDGDEALRAASLELFDIILLDLIMPQMDGYMVLQHLKANPMLRDIPVIMTTAHNEPDSVTRCIKLGAVDYIVKPIDIPMLKSRIWRQIARASLQRQGIDPAKKRQSSAGARILVVDDIELNRDMLAKRLTKANYVVKTAEGAEAAYRALAADDFDLILLDLLMPGIDGYQALEKLKADPRYARIPVIILSAADNSDSMLRGLTLGAADYVVKPYYAPILKSRIDACLAAEQYVG